MCGRVGREEEEERQIDNMYNTIRRKNKTKMRKNKNI